MATPFKRSMSEGQGHYEPHASYLNVLPSRQNFVSGNEKSVMRWLSSVGRVMGGSFEEAEALVNPCSPSAVSARKLSWDKQVSKNEIAAPLLLLPSGKEVVDKTEIVMLELDEAERLSAPEVVFNLANTVLGIGVISVPYAFALTGYSSLLLVLLVICITTKTAFFIGASLKMAEKSPDAVDVPRRARDFAFLAFVAFGERGRQLIGAITCVEIWFALVTFVVMAGVNATLVLPITTVEAIIVTCILATLMVFLPMRIYAYVSLISSAALLVAVVAMVGAALAMPSWANPYVSLGIPALVQIRNMPKSVGIILFCFAGHPCFPVVYESMADRSAWAWQKAVTTTFILASVYYGGLGCFGYLVFGQDLSVTFTENIAEIEGALWARNLSSLAFLVKILLSAPILMNAIMVSAFPPPLGSMWPPARILALLLLTAFTAFTAVAFAHSVAVVASFTGNCLCMTTSVIFPTAVHLRLSYLLGNPENSGKLASPNFLMHYLIIAFGVVMAVLGTGMAVCEQLRG